MAKKKIEETTENNDLKKVKDELKKEIDKNFKDEIKEALTEELNNYIDNQIKKAISTELEKVNKKQLRDKNKKILFKNIIIILLLALICYLVYLLNSVDYFDKFFLSNNQIKETTNVIENEDKTSENNSEEENVKEPTLEELKTKYEYLLSNIYISEVSDYLNNFYNGNLTTELKNYLTLNSIDIDSLTKEDDYNVIEDDLFKESYEKLFADAYTSTSFNYNDNKIRYISKIESYITNSLIVKNKTNIKREITDIKVNDDGVVITTAEGLVKDNKIYNIISKEEVSEYKSGELSLHADVLNKVVYTFNNDNKLTKISK